MRLASIHSAVDLESPKNKIAKMPICLYLIIGGKSFLNSPFLCDLVYNFQIFLIAIFSGGKI